MRVRRQWGQLLLLGGLVVAAQGCESKPPQVDREAGKHSAVTDEGSKTATPLAPAAKPVGRWRGERTCLELFANGDAEISLHGHQGKVLVMGRAEISEQSDSGFRVAVSNVKVWKARFVGPCRRFHETGAFADRIAVLGTTVEKDEAIAFTMKKIGDDAWELCGERCERLVPDEPLLGARWRRADPGARDPGSQYSRSSAFSGPLGEAWEVGELLDLKLNAGTQHLWIGGQGKQPIQVSATMTVRFDQSDRFLIEVMPAEVQGSDDKTSTVLGLSVQAGVALTLRAHRLANQELEVCGATKQCQILERQFNSDSYDLR